jgi:hypothetical protein
MMGLDVGKEREEKVGRVRACMISERGWKNQWSGLQADKIC